MFAILTRSEFEISVELTGTLLVMSSEIVQAFAAPTLATKQIATRQPRGAVFLFLNIAKSLVRESHVTRQTVGISDRLCRVVLRPK